MKKILWIILSFLLSINAYATVGNDGKITIGGAKIKTSYNDISGARNFGIDTTNTQTMGTPAALLHVYNGSSSVTPAAGDYFFEGSGNTDIRVSSAAGSSSALYLDSATTPLYASIVADVPNGLLSFYANTAKALSISSAGAILPNNVHNNGGTGNASNQAFASGTYTPTLFNTTNITGSTAFTCQWMRVGNVVTVSGEFNIDPTTASSVTTLGMSLPVASTFAANSQAGGIASQNVSSVTTAPPYMVYADTVNHRVSFENICGTNVSNLGYLFTFTYLVV